MIVQHKYVEKVGSQRMSCSHSLTVTCNEVTAKQTAQQCFCHWAVRDVFHGDRWCGQLENNGEGHNRQDVAERPCLHLYWLSVSASETTSHLASLITHYINFIQRVSSLSPRPNVAQHPVIEQVQGSNGCAVRLLSDLQHTRGLETHPSLQGDAISIVRTGLEYSPCLCASLTVN